MKMFLSVTFATVISLSNFAFAHGGAEGEISAAKAGELALHRIGKLVDLKKIDAAFVSQIAGVQVAVLPDGNSAGAAYKAIGYLSPGSDGKSSKIEILIDGAGKALSNVVSMAQGTSGVQWPSADPLTISENAFHYVLDHAADAAVKPYFDGFTQMTLAESNEEAEAVFKSSQSSKTLVVHVSLDGIVTSAEVK
jgi:hypothetical protein